MKCSIVGFVAAVVALSVSGFSAQADNLSNSITYRGCQFSFETYTTGGVSLNAQVNSPGRIDFAGVDIEANSVIASFMTHPLTADTATPLYQNLNLDDQAGSGIYIGENVGMYNWDNGNGITNSAYVGIATEGFTVTGASANIYPEQDGGIYFGVIWNGSWSDGGVLGKGLDVSVESAPITSVPEPASFGFLSVAALVLLRRWRSA